MVLRLNCSGRKTESKEDKERLKSEKIVIVRPKVDWNCKPS
jgi:hypothetical protein